MRFLPLLMLFALHAHSQSQYISIKGKLIDSKTKEPVPFASVYVKGQTLGTATNDEGMFLFHVPTVLAFDTLIISFIGYTPFKSLVASMGEKERLIELKQSTLYLKEVLVKGTKDNLTAKEIVKNAVAAISDNYPMSPFVIEGFFRDLQRENGKPVELLEAAVRFKYEDYNPGYEEVDIIEVRRSYNQRHPVNGTYDRQNSIIDLMEDNYIKHRFGPIKQRGWKFEVDSVLMNDSQTIYKISGTKNAGETALLYIDLQNFSILRVEVSQQMVDGKFYRRYLNLPDPYGLQETSYKTILEFQKIDGKMYLKFQREEDTYNLFIKATQEVALEQSFIKELFINNIVKDSIKSQPGQAMDMNKSVEGQAGAFNEQFWKYYNIPVETSKYSKIVKELQGSEK